MVFTLDIGNTSIHAGVFDDGNLVSSFRFKTDKSTGVEYYINQFKDFINDENLNIDMVDGAILACVVPEVIEKVSRAIEDFFSITPIIVDSDSDIGMPILIDNPGELGADRIVNAFAAYKRFNKSVIVVDFGTATTLDCISDFGEYLGGVIAPGISISAEALFDRASKLPKVELKKPNNIVGKNTIECIQSGIINGSIALVDGLIDQIKNETNSNSKIIATGGFAELISQHSKTIELVDEILTLKGLNDIYFLNV